MMVPGHNSVTSRLLKSWAGNPYSKCALCYIFGDHPTEKFDDTTIQSFDDVIKHLIKHLKSEYHKNLELSSEKEA
ncbi:unnamed protein product [Arabis nemorensis]|uniref:Uncharacterized protein n=1 Tax=Arabis nemorensis TaxID=586526 RepID=A0A565CKG0_9BRAS|nr:unnamed protein product [Arabis nemorensis]